MSIRQVLEAASHTAIAVIGALAAWSPLAASAATPDVGAGRVFSCALSAAGGVTCWGDNQYGELGDGSFVDSATPVSVAGLGSGVTKLAVGYRHACAITAGGGVKCWGRGQYGQLGNGSTQDRPTLVSVTGLDSGVADLAAGGAHTCAVSTAGALKCWGSGFYGALGNGGNTGSTVPVDVTGLGSNVARVTAGWDHTCALTTGGGVQCFGANGGGQLGNGATTKSNVPVAVTGLASGISAISAYANTSCALTTGGGVKCWGDNTFGSLGDGTRISRSVPGDVATLTSGVAAIGGSCAIVSGGTLKCWGANDSGQVGDGTMTSHTTPVSVSGIGGSVTAVAQGNQHTCALLASGATQCWGDNELGQLGNGTTSTSRVPVVVAGYSAGVAAVSKGGIEVRCFVTTAGGAKCMGTSNDGGELGTGFTWTTAPTPGDVPGLTSGVTAVTTGVEHGCALLATGGVKCWGWNSVGSLGDGTNVAPSAPVDVSGLTGAIAIDAGRYHTCAIVTGGALKCWGMNSSGQLGNGTTADSNVPVNVSGLGSGVTAVAGGDSHTCAIVSGGAMCWGSGTSGELGNGANANSSVPVAVSGLASGVSAITAGSGHSCGVANGGAKCWGTGTSGQLGNSSYDNASSPVSVTGLSTGVTAISAGSSFTCAATSLGAQCWGFNEYGTLGNADAMRATNGPQPVVGLGGALASLGTGGRNACAVTSGGALECWGAPAQGSSGRNPGSSLPVNVVKGSVVWRNASGVDVSWAWTTGAAGGFTTAVLPGVDASWSAVATCGITAKGASDVVWFRAADGQVAIWLMNGTDAVAGVSFPAAVGPGSPWQIQGCGDLDGDGIGDILWRNATTGEVVIWYLLTNGNLGQVLSLGVVPTNYVIRALADVNGDGVQDIVFFDQASGQVVVYQMNPNGSYVAQFPGNVGPGSAWNIYKAGDFDGDGKDDLLWRHTDGTTAAWYMNGGSVAAGQFLHGAALASWTVSAAGNYADSGAKALLWYSPTSGQVVRWSMQGRTTLPVVDPVMGIGGGWAAVQ